MASSQSSLRGNLLWQELERIGTGVATTTTKTSTTPDDLSWAERYLPDSLFSWETKKKSTGNKKKKTKSKNKSKLVSALTTATTTIQQAAASDTWGMSGIVLPAIDVPEMQLHKERSSNYDVNDRKLYRAASSSAATPTTLTRNRGESTTSHRRRTVILHESMMIPTTGSINAYNKKHLTLYPPDFTDNTQLYGILDSSDERVKTMERRPPLVDGECVPMQEWQTTFYPSCNSMHEVDMSGQRPETDLHLFGTKGYWRNAWRVDDHTPEQHDTLVLKTLKIEHRFEEAHFEHDRIDAVAMERLTSSPHVINIFSFCGHSVMTEHADGNRLGELADKSKKTPLARLRIARDIASGLADVHGIDGDGNATFVHLDINPANVISIDGTLKLNDFNIGIIRKWNTTSNQPCGFPAQYPNPQWRSPEEARNEQNLTEKVDIFSMGHIFFRLICGHEPWHKLEPGGKPTKQEMNEKVQKGILPTIPDFVKTSTSPEVVAIREAMLRCYEYDPSHRPSARQIAASLQTALDKLESKEAA